MKLLLTSSGVSNPSIGDALTDLLGKPVDQAGALFIPTALYPFPGGPAMAWRVISGTRPTRLVDLGWKSLGILEPSVLPSIDEAVWVPTVRAADAILVGGGDPFFLATWLRRSGLADLLPELESVYVGVSAGAMAVTSTFVETYTEPPSGENGALKSEQVVFTTPDGDVDRLLVTGQGAGLVDFALIPHLDNPNHADASLPNAKIWASRIPAPTYAIDDQTAIKVADGNIEIVSEGNWHLFEPTPT